MPQRLLAHVAQTAASTSLARAVVDAVVVVTMEISVVTDIAAVIAGRCAAVSTACCSGQRVRKC